MISEMGASRETASWPFSLLGAVSNIFAVVSGVLIRRLPLRTVSILGSLLVATGVLLCAAVYNITAIIISLGVITSIGQGLIFPSNMVAINSYFQKYRASGSGISYVGGTLVSFVFPPILLYLNETYGLRGTLLIVGGFTLNAVAGSLLISRPEERRPKARTVEEPLTPLQKVDEPPTEKQTKPLSTFRKELSFFKRPMYYVIVVTGVVYAYDLVMFNVTIVDYGIGQGHSKWEAALLLSCYGCGDLIGRIFSGQLSDRKICRRRHVMAASFLVLSGSFVSLVHSLLRWGLPRHDELRLRCGQWQHHYPVLRPPRRVLWPGETAHDHRLPLSSQRTGDLSQAATHRSLPRSRQVLREPVCSAGSSVLWDRSRLDHRVFPTVAGRQKSETSRESQRTTDELLSVNLSSRASEFVRI
uniref:Putative monocarboxylate transporter n=1 Tax=Ixodes ricinus TaxID=34613 RepID=V5H0P9_IXORI